MHTIAIDVDDVTADLVSAWLDRYNLDHNDSLSEKDIKTWDIGSHTKIGDKMYEYLTPDLYDLISPIFNSLWGIGKLREMGNKVIFVTSFLPSLAGRKYHWLKFYGFLESQKDYIEAKDKSLIRCDYLIDDSPDNIINSYGIPIVFTREWNKQLWTYDRVDNWVDIVSYFSGVMEMTGV